jgi:hypothetical protein
MKCRALAVLATLLSVYSQTVSAEPLPQPPTIYLVPHGAGAGMEYPLAAKNWWGQMEYRYLDNRADSVTGDSFDDHNRRDTGSHLLHFGLTYKFPLR